MRGHRHLTAHLSDSALMMIQDCRCRSAVHAEYSLEIIRLDVAGTHVECIASFLMESSQVEELRHCLPAARVQVRVALLQHFNARGKLVGIFPHSLQRLVLSLQVENALRLFALCFLKPFDLRAEAHGHSQRCVGLALWLVWSRHLIVFGAYELSLRLSGVI